MNRRGISALTDAVVFIAIIAVAANILLSVPGYVDPGSEVQDPSEVLERVMASKMDYSDIGMVIDAEWKVPVSRLAYISICKGDGAFKDYLSGVLGSVYPWDSSFHFTVTCSKGTEEAGIVSGICWKEVTRTYESGYSDPITVVLRVYR